MQQLIMDRIPNKLMKKKLPTTRLPSLHQQYPWLVLSDGENKKQQIFYSIYENRSYVIAIPELQNKCVVTCTNKKWLAIQNNSTGKCFLMNLSTMMKIPLPPLTNLMFYSKCALSSSKMDSLCRVMFFSVQYPGRILSCNLGDNEFFDQQVAVEGKNEPIEDVVNFEGKLYALTLNFYLLVARYSDPILLFKPIILGEPLYKLLPLHDEMKIYLVESCGDLLFIYARCRDCELTDIKVYKADIIIGEWVRVQNLGDHAIFLDAYSSFSSPASRFGLKGNCVYWVSKRGRHFFVFDLEDQSVTMSLPCPSAKFNSLQSWMSVSYC